MLSEGENEDEEDDDDAVADIDEFRGVAEEDIEDDDEDVLAAEVDGMFTQCCYLRSSRLG